MGAGTGGTSTVQSITNGQTVSIPLPTDGSLVNSVLIYNYSPFLVQVTLGTSNAWLSAWMVDKFTLTNVSNIKCNATQVVGGASPSSTGQITAAFVLEGDDLTDIGTYPAPLFHLAQFLDIVYPDGNPAVQIGPGESITMMDDATGNVTSEWTPTLFEFINSANTGRIRILPNGDPTTGNFPGIYYDTALTPGAYLNTAWMQANPDALGNPQIGINSGAYTDTSGHHNTRGRLLMVDHVSVLQNIDTTTQGALGGAFEASDTNATMRYYDTASSNSTGLVIDSLTRARIDVALQLDLAWTNLAPAGGWSTAGVPNPPFGYRRLSSGVTQFRGTLLGGAIADGTQIATLPAGTFNSAVQTFARVGYTGAGGSGSRVTIDPAGNMTIAGMSGGAGLIMFDGFSIPFM